MIRMGLGEKTASRSAMRMRHLSVTLSVEFADTDTAQKAHYRPDTDNRSDNHCITNFYQSHGGKSGDSDTK